MNNYQISYSEYDSEENSTITEKFVSLRADDEIHAINQLLDYYKDMSCKVSCIESVVRSLNV